MIRWRLWSFYYKQLVHRPLLYDCLMSLLWNQHICSDNLIFAVSKFWILWPQDTILHISSIFTTNKDWQLSGMLTDWLLLLASLSYLPSCFNCVLQIVDAIISHGCFLRECRVEHSIVGERSRIDYGVELKVIHHIFGILILKYKEPSRLECFVLVAPRT